MGNRQGTGQAGKEAGRVQPTPIRNWEAWGKGRGGGAGTGGRMVNTRHRSLAR